MTTWIYVGTSRLAGRTFGLPQYLAGQAGWQLIGIFNEFEAIRGYRPTVNEGKRSRADQALLRAAYEHYVRYGTPWAALAAALYFSTHDEENHGNAADIGGPDGEPLSEDDHALLIEIGAKYGLVWTGRWFSTQEWWHFNVYPEQASVLVAAGTQITGTAPDPADTTTPHEEDDDVKTLFIAQTKWSKKPSVLDTWLFDCSDLANPTYIHLGSQAEINLYTALGAKVITGPQPANLFTRYRCADKSGGIR
jgi:hypothetical protein